MQALVENVGHAAGVSRLWGAAQSALSALNTHLANRGFPTIIVEEKGGIFLNVPKQRVSARRKRLRMLSTKLAPTHSYRVCPDCGTPNRSLHVCPCIQRRLLKSETLFDQAWHKAIAKAKGLVAARPASAPEAAESSSKE